MSFDLSGEVAVVTGACGKLGPTWIRALIDAGARVLAIDLPDAVHSSAWESLVAQPDASYLTFVAGDALDRESAGAALRVCVDVFGPPSILVNNAGIDSPPGSDHGSTIDRFPVSEFNHVLTTNVTSAVVMSEVVGRAMRAAGGGSIVNITSLYASVSPDARFYDHLGSDPPYVKPPAYGASKAALVNITRYLATHWAQFNIRVNALSPGGVVGGQDPEFIDKFAARVPLGRMAEPDDLSGPLVFLASNASRYVTGIDLLVDGGFTAW